MNNWYILFIDEDVIDSGYIYKYMVDSTFDIVCQEGEEVVLGGIFYIISRVVYDYFNKKILCYLEEN